MSQPDLKLRGRCWVLGDDLIDFDLIAQRFLHERVSDPAVLKPQLFASILPGFADQARPGDIVVAGKNFLHGKAHVQPFLAMAAHGIGFLVESTPYMSIRSLVAYAVPFLAPCPGVSEFAANGDDLEVDFVTGRATNHTRQIQRDYPPLDGILLEIVQAGGLDGHIRQRVAART